VKQFIYLVSVDIIEREVIMKKEWLVKTLALGVIVLFIIVDVSFSLGISNYLDDTTPPVTTISFNPPEPDGENGWYISNVTVTLNASDDDSGVNTTMYRINGDIWQIYSEPFILDFDGENILIEFYSIDNAGNVEPINRFYINIDGTKPNVNLMFEVYCHFGEETRYFFTAFADDSISGVDRVEFYLDNEYQETVFGPGPEYNWTWKPRIYDHVIGFILKPEITEEYVKFYALFVIAELGLDFPICYVYGYDKAGNMESDKLESLNPPYDMNDYLLFQNLKLSNIYDGYIGRFFINIRFNTN
jgi:hypothetical protein